MGGHCPPPPPTALRDAPGINRKQIPPLFAAGGRGVGRCTKYLCSYPCHGWPEVGGMGGWIGEWTSAAPRKSKPVFACHPLVPPLSSGPWPQGMEADEVDQPVCHARFSGHGRAVLKGQNLATKQLWPPTPGGRWRREGMHWKGGGGTPLPPSRASSLCPVPLTHCPPDGKCQPQWHL